MVWVLMVVQAAMVSGVSTVDLMAALTVRSPMGVGLTREPKPLKSNDWKAAHRSVAVPAAQVSQVQAPARVLVRVQGLATLPLPLRLQPLLSFFFCPLGSKGPQQQGLSVLRRHRLPAQAPLVGLVWGWAVGLCW